MPRKPNHDRAELIDRARDLFWRQGWAGTSLKDLEAVLKMKPGSFYAAFGSKEALFEIALDKYAEDGAGRLAELVAAHGPMAALKRYPELAICREEAPEKDRGLSHHGTAHGHPLAKRASAHLMGMEEQFAALFAQMQRDGEIGAAHDPKALARRYQSDLLGLRVSAEREGIDAHAIAREIAEGLERL